MVGLNVEIPRSWHILLWYSTSVKSFFFIRDNHSIYVSMLFYLLLVAPLKKQDHKFMYHALKNGGADFEKNAEVSYLLLILNTTSIVKNILNSLKKHYFPRAVSQQLCQKARHLLNMGSILCGEKLILLCTVTATSVSTKLSWIVWFKHSSLLTKILFNALFCFSPLEATFCILIMVNMAAAVAFVMMA